MSQDTFTPGTSDPGTPQPTRDAGHTKLAVMMSFSGAGGVEKMVMNLLRELAKHINGIDLLVLRAKGPHFANIPANINVIQLRSQHTFTAIPEIACYLRKHKPERMLVAKDRAARAAVRARALSGVSTPITVRLGTNLSTALTHRSRINAWLRTFPMKRIYAKLDKVVAVSQGVADDTCAITGIAPEKTVVIRNPVITPDFFPAPNTPAPHPWLSEKTLPVIMGVGRFSVQKDFATLIKAFHAIQHTHPSRLMILGDGKMREELSQLIHTLGLEERVALPGFQTQVTHWVSHANVFVLSSRWEGSPNALTEALALGIPSVSTRCPSGPDEVLDNGRYGPLVPVGDDATMAEAIKHVLDHPLPAETLKSAVRDYHSHISAQHYLRILGLPACTSDQKEAQ